MRPEILQKATEWSQNVYFDQESRHEIQKLLEANTQEELTDRFYKDLEFGTGGLRGIIGMGCNRINKYTIRKATWAYAQILLKYYPRKQNLKVVISYDPRHYSLDFAKETACVLRAYGIQSYLFDELTPTPLLSFAVRALKAEGGIMITASHNPINYNGYKVYWSDGAQVTPPYDQEIIDEYNQLKDFSLIRTIPYDKTQTVVIGNELRELYYQTVMKVFFHPTLRKVRGNELKIIYTPIHGTGTRPVEELLERLHFTDVHLVEEQKKPDANFSTVKSPNPEEPAAFELASQLLKKLKGDVAFATDPDADRLGVVVMEREPFFLSGNQIAVLLLNYIIEETYETKKSLPAHPVVIKSIVTSQLQSAICQKYGVNLLNTLTGFKWMGGLMHKMETELTPFDFLFASEESFGYLVHPEARDKDAISAMGLFAEMMLVYKTRNKSVSDILMKIYQQHGFYSEKQLSFNYAGQEGQQKIQRIMQKFRLEGKKLFNHDRLQSMTDYLKHPTLPSSDVLELNFENGDTLFLRPSGTEPKIKFYIMLKIAAPLPHGSGLSGLNQMAKEKEKVYQQVINQICQTL